ncbi:MAG: sulfatase [Deltaproteobacteria bacterium]|nr:sulfatase [Deltaproteobacteria bacterium]
MMVAPDRRSIVWWRSASVSQDGHVRGVAKLKVASVAGQRVLLAPIARGQGDWFQLPHQIVTAGPGLQELRLDLAVPAGYAGARLMVIVYAVALEWAPRTLITLPAVRVPAGGDLAFATGVLEEAWDQGPVRFRVQVCHGADCAEVYAKEVDPRDGKAGKWQDESVSLERFAGQDVSIVLRTEYQPANDGAFSFPLWANPTLRSRELVRRRRPNLILLSVDTLRADRLPTYGHDGDTAPFMKELFGDRGLVFENCVAAATATPPSHMTMLTGLQPSEHGLTTGNEAVAEWIPTVVDAFRAQGMETAAVTEDGWLGIQYGFGRGFDVYSENKSPDVMNPIGQVDSTFAAAKRWLAVHRDGEFFLFLHTYQVHRPYAPPQRYREMFGGAARADAGLPRERTEELPLYDGEIRYVDDELRDLFAELERLGIADQTLFVLTSDHGEGFLEHGFVQHGAYLNEEVTHVPLMIHGPGVPVGRRISSPVGHVDLAATLAGLAHVEFDGRGQGKDLSDLVRGRADESVLDGRVYFTESWGSVVFGPGNETHPFFPPAFAVRQGSRKLARYSDQSGARRYEFYDLTADPLELSDRYDDAHAPRDLAFLLEQYPGLAARRRDELESARGAVGALQPDAPGLDPLQEEKMRALGYLN